MKSTLSFLQVFGSRKMAALLLLGFSAGMPLFMTGTTLQPWMKEQGVDLSTIGFFSLVGLPYSLKFLWSPLLDRFVPPFLGRRRGWMFLTQLLLVLAIATLAIQKPAQALQFVALNAVLIAFFSATQDIAIDAYRTDVLEKLELGAGVGVYVLGYRIALLVTGSLAFILADRLPWPVVYLLMAAFMTIGLAASIFAPEPVSDNIRPPSLEEAVILPFLEFFQRNGWLQGALILLFIVFYKFGDSLLSNMSRLFLLDVGFTKTDIGAIQGGMGLVATIVGTLAGGAILSKIGINRSLWLFGGLQALSNLGYFAISQLGQNYQMLVLTINIENFCGGLGTAAFLGFLTTLCNQRFSATQYALLSSFMAFSRDILVAPAGSIAQSTGWSVFFLITIAAALPGLLLLPVFAPWNSEPVAMPRPGLDDKPDFDA
ncbi:AmpG family muropeptide MFS transporter [Planktothrix sp. FACHB-1355]|uniref:AmpG family muropeptide MFS transporter n=2 Tax=Cyanophyceae TaxID=3028117 RepID=A0A926VDV8_9CYAN|nr:AmpG family muropeptide MFS transporter [Aerosakkonema funiforme FACHB-1375]MBD3560160.1 AmpG family muropeptide MFS transporter [Planktothrix sp. FACHB-1355]